MDRRPRSDEDLARGHRSDEPLGPIDQPEGAESDANNPSATRMDRPLAGHGGQRDGKTTGTPQEDSNGDQTRDR